MGTHISVKDAALKLGISRQRVCELCRTGKINAEKIANSWILDQASVEKYGLTTAHLVAEDHAVYTLNSQKPSDASKPIALSFFSGAMGLDLGLEKAGFEIRLACEIDKFCRQTITLNRPHTALLSDINQYQAHDIRKAAQLSPDQDIELVVGGPPCQAFSTAGKRKGLNDDRGNVFLKYLDLALDLNPQYIVIENVRGLLSCPLQHRPHEQRGIGSPPLSEDELKGGALNFILKQLNQSGYAYSFNLYNAANFGTPQQRERVIIICARNGKTPPFLQPTHSETGDYGLPHWTTVQTAIQELHNHHHLNFPEKRLKYYKLLKSGENWKKLPENLQKEALGKSYYSGGGKTGFLRRLAWDKPSPTLVTHPAMPATDLAHPEEHRPLSIEEYKRIQEFPDNWQLAGALIQQYKQIGNAVPIGLGYAIGRLIQNLLHGVEIYNPKGFPYSRYKATSHTEWEQKFKQMRSNHCQGLAEQQELNFG